MKFIVNWGARSLFSASPLLALLLLALTGSSASARSASTQLVQVEDTLDLYRDGVKLDTFELWPFPFLEHVSHRECFFGVGFLLNSDIC